jgi:predicted DNA-binding protein (UPF0251 family)
MYQKSVTDEQILLVMFKTMTHKEAAAALGISTTTLWRRLKTPEFRRKFLAARKEANAENLECLARASRVALMTLIKTMVDQKGGPSSRVKAAICALTHADTFALENLQIGSKEELSAGISPDSPPPEELRSFGEPKKTLPWDEFGTAAAKRDRIILALLEHGSKEKAAAALGISFATLWRWSQKPGFRERSASIRSEIFFDTLQLRQQAAIIARATLLAVLVDKNTPSRPLIEVSNYILERANVCAYNDVRTEMNMAGKTLEEQTA